MKRIKNFTAIFIIILFSQQGFGQNEKFINHDWMLGIQSYTFHKFSFQEAVDKTRQLNLDFLEVYYGQSLGEGMEGAMDFRMDKALREKVLQYAESKKVQIVASGVVICESETEWDQLFEFADAMGIKIITCEPRYQHLSHVDKLANKYKIDVAVHNHPKPSDYWNPDLFLNAVEGLSDRIGVCADVGHWARMGLDPVDCLRKCKGRIKSLHFKDIKAKADGESEQHDVIWGTGILDIQGMLAELKMQNFKGFISIEYEQNWENSLPDIKQNIQYFNKKVSDLF